MATATDLSPIETAKALQALVREHADEAEEQGYVSELVVRALAGAGLYRLCAPAVFGAPKPTRSPRSRSSRPSRPATGPPAGR